MSVGWVYGDSTLIKDDTIYCIVLDTLFTIDVTLFADDRFGFGKLNIFRISCSCYNARSYFLPI